MDFKDFIVKNYPTGITKLTLNRLDSCWQAATKQAGKRIEELEQGLKELRSDFRLECTGHAQCQEELERLQDKIGERRQHSPGCLAGEERRKNLMRWEPFPDCSCGQD